MCCFCPSCRHGHHQKSMCSMPPRHAKQSSAKWLEASSHPLRSAQPKRLLKQNKNSSTWNKAHEYIMELSIFKYPRNHQTYILVQGCSRYEKQASAISKPNPLGSACNLKKTPPTFSAKSPPAKGRKKMHRLRGFFSEFSSTSKTAKKKQRIPPFPTAQKK